MPRKVTRLCFGLGKQLSGIGIVQATETCPLASKNGLCLMFHGWRRAVGGLTVEVGSSVDEDNMLSWRHGDRRSELAEDALPWSPTRLLQKSFWQTWFKTSPTVQAH